jgi:hypothetical protein
MATRESETRSAKSRKSTWKPPSLLPTPDAQDGYNFRWVRVGSHGQLDNKNVSSRFREGWVPVNAKDHPELQLVSDTHGARFQDGVEIGGLLLCKTAKENVEARNEYWNTRNQQIMQSVDNDYLRDQHPNMPKLSERRSRVTFGNGSSE